MERATKRVKTHGFENDDEAEAYLDSLLLGIPELPLEIWVKILSSNPALSVQDIQRMCRVNSLFKQMCDTGIVWDEIFKRQFPGELAQIRNEFPDPEPVGNGENVGKNALLRLLATRISKLPHQLQDGYNHIVFWSIGKEGIKLRYELFAASGAHVILLNPSELSILNEIENIFRSVEYTEFVRTRIAFIWKVIRINPETSRKLIMVGLKHGLLPFWNTEHMVYLGSTIFCSNCETEAFYKCGGCHQQYYCGQDCAQKDWEHQHHKTCSK